MGTGQQELAGEFDLSDQSGKEAFLTYVYDCFADVKLEDLQKIIPELGAISKQEDLKAHAKSGEGMGALINYNNEIKNKWRQKLKEFIDENTDPEKRANMKVLCLPGVECLEIPLYLELGFKPENIVGVEAGIVGGKIDQSLIERFRENATRYGIQTRIGKLEKLMETEETVFDVVSLDFLGGWNNLYSQICRKIRYSSNPLIITNVQGKREDRKIADYLQEANSTVAKMNMGVTTPEKGLDRNYSLSSAILSGIACGLNRETGFYQFMKETFAKAVSVGGLRFNEDTELQVLLDSIQFFDSTFLPLLTSAYDNNSDTEYMIRGIRQNIYTIHNKLTTRADIYAQKKYKYQADKTSMFTDCMQLSFRVNDDYQLFLPYYKFLRELIRIYIATLNGKPPRGCIQLKSKIRKDVSITDEFVIQNEGRTIKLSIGQIFSMVENWMRRYPGSGKDLTIERIAID